MTHALHHGDSLAFMRDMPSASVDLIATDPPYFKVKPHGWDRQWDKASGFLEWCSEVLAEMERILKPNGSLYWFASPQMTWAVEGRIRERFQVLNNIRWAKPSGRSNGACKQILRSYFPEYETAIFAEQRGSDSMARGEAGYVTACDELRGFVFEPLRAYLAGEWERAGLTSRDANEVTSSCMAGHWFTRSQWTLPTADKYALLQARANVNGGEFLRREYEDLRREYEDLRREYEDLRRPFCVTAEVAYTDTWTFPTVQSYAGKHPCEKPLALMEQIVSASSRPGAVVFDPFMGSGTTGVAAVRLGRDFIGCDLGGEWVSVARRRIESINEEPAQLMLAAE